MKNLTDYLFDKLLAAEEAKFEAEKRVIELETEREAAEQRIWELEAELHSATASNSVEKEQVCCSCNTRHACDTNCPPVAYRMLESGEEIKPGDEYFNFDSEWVLARDVMPYNDIWTKDYRPFRRAI